MTTSPEKGIFIFPSEYISGTSWIPPDGWIPPDSFNFGIQGPGLESVLDIESLGAFLTAEQITEQIRSVIEKGIEEGTIVPTAEGITVPPLDQNLDFLAKGLAPELAHGLENTVHIYGEVDVPDHSTFFNPFDTRTIKFSGSGFFTDGGTVVTNHHVANPAGHYDDIPSDAPVRISIVPCGGPQKGEILEVKELTAADLDKANDLAALTVTPPTEYPGVEISPPGPEYVTQEVVIIGSPAHQSCSIVSGTISKVEPMGTRGEELKPGWGQTDSGAAGGNSGSGVYDLETGKLIGVFHSGMGGTDVGFYTDSETTVAFLERREAHYAAETDEVVVSADDADATDADAGEEVSAEDADATESGWTQVLSGVEGKLAAEVAGDHTPAATLDRLAEGADAQAEIDGPVDGDDLPDLPV